MIPETWKNHRKTQMVMMASIFSLSISNNEQKFELNICTIHTERVKENGLGQTIDSFDHFWNSVDSDDSFCHLFSFYLLSIYSISRSSKTTKQSCRSGFVTRQFYSSQWWTFDIYENLFFCSIGNRRNAIHTDCVTYGIRCCPITNVLSVLACV